MRQEIVPLGFTFALLTKQYISALNNRLTELPIDKYYYAFWVVAKESGKLVQQDLVHKLGSDKVTVCRIVDYLECEHFIQRITNPNDRRSHLLQVAPLGEKYVQVIEEAFSQTNQQFLSLINDKEGSMLKEILQHLVNGLDDYNLSDVCLDYDIKRRITKR